jgi:hypothetical protein
MVPAKSNPAPALRRNGRRARQLLRVALGGALLLALLVAGHALLWRWMGTQLGEGFAAWAAARRAQGWRVEHEAPVLGGWPFAAVLTLPQFRLEGGGVTLPGGMAWQVEALRLRLQPPRLDRLVVEMGGRQRLRLGELELPYAADRLAAVMPLERHVLPREAELQAERLRVGTPAGALELRRLSLQVETRVTAIEGEPAVALHMQADTVTLPGSQPATTAGALGREVQEAALHLVLTGPVPPGRTPVQRAEAWRDGGGTLELRGMDLRWGELVSTTTATLTLDESLQPMGAGTLRLAGAGSMVEAATASGLLAPRQAGMARALLVLLQRPAADGGPPQVEVPLTLEDRTLSLARIPVLRLQPWTWPASPAPEEPDAASDPSLPAQN